MHDINGTLAMMARHGYSLTFVIFLAEAVGLPFPASIALVAAGAAVASHKLSASGIVIAGVIAILIGDSWQYFLGRCMGWTLLGFLCRLSMNPETCILRSAESFYKRGKTTLVIAKFVPGINTMAAPLAGSMKMRFAQFLRLDLVGALLYVVNMNHIVMGTDEENPIGLWLGFVGIGVVVLSWVMAHYLSWHHPRLLQHALKSVMYCASRKLRKI